MIYKKIIETPIGKIYIAEENNKIIEINLDSKKNNYEIKNTMVLNLAEKQLLEYFEGKRKKFDLPLKLKGTPFQEKVWNELLKIPYGETRTYGEIAKNIENPKAARAVGMANHNNPISIVVPCHRVIGVNNRLVGYGLGLDKKQYLLDLEKRTLRNVSKAKL